MYLYYIYVVPYIILIAKRSITKMCAYWKISYHTLCIGAVATSSDMWPEHDELKLSNWAMMHTYVVTATIINDGGIIPSIEADCLQVMDIWLKIFPFILFYSVTLWPSIISMVHII